MYSFSTEVLSLDVNNAPDLDTQNLLQSNTWTDVEKVHLLNDDSG